MYSNSKKQSVDLTTEGATQPVLSPDGLHLAYVALSRDGQLALWVSDMDGNNRVKKFYLAKSDGSGVRQIRWSGSDIARATWARTGGTYT